VIFTAATQDYADWVIDQIDPENLVTHRLYRQHALPWGPLFAKDLSRLGRDLDRTLIIDNVQENFMLQPNNGIFILPWYEDPHDTALFTLTPLLEELVQTRSRVPDIFDKYREQIPTWAGFDQYSQLGGDCDDGLDDGYFPVLPTQHGATQQDFHNHNHTQQPMMQQQQDYPPPQQQQPQARAEYRPQQGSHQPALQQPYEVSQPQYMQQPSGYPQAQYAPQRPAPQQQQQQAAPPGAPVFSKVSGPFQAAPPQQAQPPQSQVAKQPMMQNARPASAAIWGRAGLGSHQYIPQR